MTLQTRLTDLATAVGADIKSLNGKVLASGAVLMDTWHVVGAAGEPAFQNSWVNFGGIYATLAFRKDPFGKVKLRGTIKGGVNGTAVFTLPVGYRPPADIAVPVETMSGANTAYCSVSAANGQVVIAGQAGITAGTATWVDAVEFDTESVTQLPTGPRGPTGLPGTNGVISKVQRSTDLINFIDLSARGNLGFAGQNWTITDDGGGGNDRTRVAYGPLFQSGGTLPNVGVPEGTEYHWVPDPTNNPNVTWHMIYRSGWKFVGGAPLSYRQEGENNAYVGMASGTNITVNAAQTKLLQWIFTSPIDLWVEVEFSLGIVNKIDAAYHYAQFNIILANVAIGSAITVIRTQHASVQQYEPYFLKGKYGVNAGVTCQFYVSVGLSGGTWQYHQGPTYLLMTGRAWPR